MVEILFFFFGMVFSWFLCRGCASGAALFERKILEESLGKFRTLFVLTSKQKLWALTALAAGATTLLVWFISRSSLLAFIIGALCAGLSPLIAWKLYRGRYQKRLLQTYPEALEMIASQLSTGHSLAAGIQTLAKSAMRPIGREFDLIWQQYQLSGSLEEGIALFCQRWPHWATDGFRISVSVSRRTGANTAEMLRSLARALRAEENVSASIRTLTLQARIQGCIAIAIPWFLFIGESIMQPALMRQALQSQAGKPLLAGAILLDLMGAWLLARFSKQQEE